MRQAGASTGAAGRVSGHAWHDGHRIVNWSCRRSTVLSAALMLLAALPAEAHGAYPAPPGGGDHACMAYASFRALSEEERAWLYPEIPAFMQIYTELPDMNWNNYGTFGGWSGLPDQPRTPDLRREYEICEFTGWNPNTGVGRRFGHEPEGLRAAIPWYLPRIVDRFRAGQFQQPIMQLGALCHLIQDCATFPGVQALHRTATADWRKINIDGYQPRIIARDVDGLVTGTLAAANEMIAWCDQQIPALRAAQQSGDAATDESIRVACCNRAAMLCADLMRSLIALVGECPRPGPPELGVNLVANPGAEEEDPGERLPRHWVVGYGDLNDRVGRAEWEGQIQRNLNLWREGRHSLKLMWTPAAGLEWHQSWPCCTYVRPGEYYAASAWVKLYAATGQTQVLLAFYDEQTRPVAEIASAPLAGTADFQRLRVAAAVPEGAVRARVILRSYRNEGAAWFDEIELTRVDVSTAQAIQAAGTQDDPLVLHLPFDTGVQDLSAHRGLNAPIAALSGTQASDLIADDPQRGRALVLDGLDDFVEVPHSNVEDVLSPPEMTIALWLKAERPGPALIVGKMAGAGDHVRGWRLDLTAEGRLRFAVAVGGAMEPAAEAPVPLGQWVQVAAVRDAGGNMTVFVDGQPGASVTRPGAYLPADRALYVGADYGASHFLAGRVDDLRIYRRALSAEELAALR